MSNFVQNNAENFAEAHSEQIAAKAVEIIDELIDLKSIIELENATIIAEFEEAMSKVAEEDKEIFKDHIPTTLEFKTIIEKFEYAFKKLILAGYTLLHDVSPAGDVAIKIYKVESTTNYKFKSSYSVGLEPKS